MTSRLEALDPNAQNKIMDKKSAKQKCGKITPIAAGYIPFKQDGLFF